jgi:hypothetical protein
VTNSNLSSEPGVRLGSAEQAGPAVAKPSDAAWMPSQHERKSNVWVLHITDWYSQCDENSLDDKERNAGSCLVINRMV